MSYGQYGAEIHETLVSCLAFTDMNSLPSIPGAITGSIPPGLHGWAAAGADTLAIRAPGEDVIQRHRERGVRCMATGEQGQSQVLIPGLKEFVLGSDLTWFECCGLCGRILISMICGNGYGYSGQLRNWSGTNWGVRSLCGRLWPQDQSTMQSAWNI